MVKIIKLILTVFLAVPLCTGCFTRTVYVHQPLPLIEAPARPVLAPINMFGLPTVEQSKVVDNFNRLTSWGSGLEAGIKSYNDYATQNNIKGLEGLKP